MKQRPKLWVEWKTQEEMERKAWVLEQLQRRTEDTRMGNRLSHEHEHIMKHIINKAYQIKS